MIETQSALQSRKFCKVAWTRNIYYWHSVVLAIENLGVPDLDKIPGSILIFRNRLPEQLSELWAQVLVYEHWACLGEAKVTSVDATFTSLL